MLFTVDFVRRVVMKLESLLGWSKSNHWMRNAVVNKPPKMMFGRTSVFVFPEVYSVIEPTLGSV